MTRDQAISNIHGHLFARNYDSKDPVACIVGALEFLEVLNIEEPKTPDQLAMDAAAAAVGSIEAGLVLTAIERAGLKVVLA